MVGPGGIFAFSDWLRLVLGDENWVEVRSAQIAIVHQTAKGQAGVAAKYTERL